MPVSFSQFASAVQTETAFDVLAAARRLKAAGKDVIELEIGDSPFPSTAAAAEAGIEAIRQDHCHYGPSLGLPDFRAAASDYINREYGLATTEENIVAAPGAKPFETLFCEAFLDAGDGVLVFTPHFPTYPPNIARRQARMVLAPLLEANEFRPQPADVEKFLATDPRPKAIFLNSPHNPTGGVATEDDLKAIADLVRGKDVAILSDEPYDQMVWRGRHHSILAQPGMMEQTLAAYTFSKSFSMSGWRIGFAAGSAEIAKTIGKLINTSLSCTPPFVQIAAAAALRKGTEERDERMAAFRAKVQLLAAGLRKIPGVSCLDPAGTFYVFPNVSAICQRLGITSHGLAMYLLEAADEKLGVACLGGECFGAAGAGFLRLSCAESDERLEQAVGFIEKTFEQPRNLDEYLKRNQKFCMANF
jgi:aspartate aminotransferase